MTARLGRLVFLTVLASGCGSSDDDTSIVRNPTFAGLYADYFGPTGKASCSGDGACHGARGQPGAISSNFICAADKDTCYATMTGASGLAKPSDASGTSYLEAILRKESGGGSMPLRPNTVTFSRDDIARIRQWITNGAKND